MVCPTSILTASLALSLLRNSSPPDKSFVFSPFSLNTALSIVHNGASGETQEELTQLLLNECTPSDVTKFYSSLANSISSNSYSAVTFNSATRFYVADSISLKPNYQEHIEEKYKVKVENLNLQNKVDAAQTINDFVDISTNGKIREIVSADSISDGALAYLINAIYFYGKWKYPFNPRRTQSRPFHGVNGRRNMDFMSFYEGHFRVNTDFGTVLLMPYQDERYNFFYIMQKESSNLETLRGEVNGELLLHLLRNANNEKVTIVVPKFKLESKLDGTEVLRKFGVETLFNANANFTKISSTPLRISKVQHKAMIEMDEVGTEAAAFTGFEVVLVSAGGPVTPTITIDRPFLFGTIRNEDILFLGQFA